MNALKINLKNPRRSIVFSFALVGILSSMVVFVSAFSDYEISKTMSSGAPAAQANIINAKPYLTWQAVKKLAAGSLDYTDIRDAYFYKEIGSGLYILRFPIQDAPEFSLTISAAGPNAAPLSMGLRCEPADLSLKLNRENLGIMMALSDDSGSQQEINKLFRTDIPVPQDARTYGNILYLTGRAPDEMIQDYGDRLLHNGWELTDALGMKRFYKKTVNGETLIISVLCLQEGGPQDKDIVTVIRFNLETLSAKKDELDQEQQDIRTLVESFGKRLQYVSLLLPEDMAAAGIKENYSDYVTSELLQKWLADPQSAPGRTVSSPWPYRIDILRLETGDKNEYIVQGEILEVTSLELADGGAAAKRPVTLAVQNVNGRWLIGELTIGEYVQRGPIAYENTQYGFRFYLPETWKGYSIIEEQWEGTKNGELTETGTQLLIRHPAWTDKDPHQDIPLMIFTLEQWNALQKGGFFVSAAPVGPCKLGGNSSYIFALPARYNYAFQTGFEEVDEILKGSPLWPENPSGKSIEVGVKQGEKVEIRLDPYIQQDGNTFTVKSSGTMILSPELLEELRKSKEEAARIRTGLFNTELDLTQEENRVEATVSFYNISKEDLKLDFDMGCEFDFIVTDSEGEEVYSRFYGDNEVLPAISHRKLKQGEKLTFSYTWNCNDNAGNIIAPGKYSITVKMSPMINYKRNFSPDELTAVRDIAIH